MLKRRKESDTYLAADRRHRWNMQIAMKVDKVCSFQPALWPSSASADILITIKWWSSLWSEGVTRKIIKEDWEISVVNQWKISMWLNWARNLNFEFINSSCLFYYSFCMLLLYGLPTASIWTITLILSVYVFLCDINRFTSIHFTMQVLA